MFSRKDPIIASELNEEYICGVLPTNTSEKVKSAIIKGMHPSKNLRTPSITEFAANLGFAELSANEPNDLVKTVIVSASGEKPSEVSTETKIISMDGGENKEPKKQINSGSKMSDVKRLLIVNRERKRGCICCCLSHYLDLAQVVIICGITIRKERKSD